MQPTLSLVDALAERHVPADALRGLLPDVALDIVGSDTKPDRLAFRIAFRPGRVAPHETYLGQVPAVVFAAVHRRWSDGMQELKLGRLSTLLDGTGATRVELLEVPLGRSTIPAGTGVEFTWTAMIQASDPQSTTENDSATFTGTAPG